MSDFFRIGLALLLSIHLVILSAGSIRFRKWSKSEEADFFLAIPFLFVLFSTIGSFITVGLNGLCSLVGIPTLLFTGYLGKITFRKPTFNTEWHLLALLVWLILFLVRFYVLYNFESERFMCAFHDDYSYIMQINLLQINGSESTFWELIRGAFGMDYQYAFYHFSEFYIILLFQKVFGGNSYSWFNIFLKVFLSFLAIFSTAMFFRQQFKVRYRFYEVLLLVVLFYTTLRFNLIDDFLQSIFSSEYLKAVFFQNYYFPSPLAYHVSYKISIAFIFLIPLVYCLMEEKISLRGYLSFAGLASFVTVAIIPISGVIGALHLLKKSRFQAFRPHLILLGVFIFHSTAYFLNSQSSGSGFLRYSFDTAFSGFNLIFENYFWHLFYFGILLLFFSGKSVKIKILFAGILCFPVIYFYPSLLFKVYFVFILFTMVYLLRYHGLFNSFFNSEVIPSLVVLYFLTRIFPGIANLNQVYSNYLFPIISFVLLYQLFISGLELRKTGVCFVLFAVFLINLPAVAYDNRVPLHEEKIPEAFFEEKIFKSDVVRILSVNSYPSIPFLHRHLLGHGILNRLDNVVIANGGLEIFGSDELQVFRQTGYLSILQRNPAYEEMVLRHKSLKEFILERNIKVVLLERTEHYDEYLRELLPLIERRYKEEELGYDILLLR
jgi:hypothetical protein